MRVSSGRNYLVPMVVLLAVLVCGCDLLSLQGANERSLPDSLRERYQIDAAVLAVRVMHRREELKGQIEIPEELRESIFDALAEVYRATHIEARDMVVERYDIHALRNPEPFQFLVGVDSSYEWTRAWREGQRLTGHEPIDQLLQRYDLQLQEYDETGTHHSALLEAERPLNLKVLGERFEEIEGVRYAGPNTWIGSDNIEITADGDAWKLTYSHGWGDCPAGCISRHYWAFRVDNEGNVEFIKSYGDPLP